MNTVTSSIPRPEHPNPQWKRSSFINLNGEWEFEIDHGCEGVGRGFHKSPSLSSKITVPFCPESPLSGVGYKGFMDCVWYKKRITVPEGDLKSKRAILHFGAADFKTTLWINGNRAGLPHIGGGGSFEYDITGLLTAGENIITVCCEDKTRDPSQPIGKQSPRYESFGAKYTRVTGIWQTVWLELVPLSYIKRMTLNCDLADAAVSLRLELVGKGDLSACAMFDGRVVGSAERRGACGAVDIRIPLSESHLWEVGKGNLYDLRLCFGEDEVESYFGLREVDMHDGKFRINGKSTFMRLVLDQGYYPDGIYTAPTEEALIKDIELSVKMGFNGARLHQKVFEPLFLYHADRLGYMVWGEYGSWGINSADIANLSTFLPDWIGTVIRDINHPALIGWCPFNETSPEQNIGAALPDFEFLRIVYEQTKLIDPTRPCIDTSGWIHVKTDIYDVHDYEQNAEAMRRKYDPLYKEGVLYDRYAEYYTSRRDEFPEGIQYYNGEPVFMSEYGGIGIHIESDKNRLAAWSYGNAASSYKEFYERYRGLTEALLDNPRMIGFCYTQLYDIEQEQNGLYTYDREPKFDADIISAINRGRAAIED